MTDSVDPESLAEVRDAALDAALAGWHEADSEDRLLQAMRAAGETLGLAAVLGRLGGPCDSRGAAGLVLIAERLLAGEVSFEDALAALRAPVFVDRHRAIAALFATADEKRREQAVDMVTMRLVGETAEDPELAARCYFRLGQLSSHDDNSAAHAFAAGLNKAAETGERGLQADCLLALAKYALRIKRPPDAVENAALAKRLYEQSGDAGSARQAAIVEAVGRLENADPVGAAEVVRPIVARQLQQGIEDGAVDASPILAQSIRAAAKLAFEQARTADPAAVTTYDAALALAGDTGYVYADEAADRTLIGQCLVLGGERASGARQLALAVDRARGHGGPDLLLRALTALCDCLVHAQHPDALARTAEALDLARAAPDKKSLAEVLFLRASALRQAGRLDEALAAYEEANGLESRVAFRAGQISALLDAGRDDAALDAVAALCTEAAGQDRASLGGDDAHVAMLLNALHLHGHPGAALRVHNAFENKAAVPADAMIGSVRGVFVRRAMQVLADAGARLAAGQHDAVTALLQPVHEQARSLGELSIELSAAYMLGENALLARRFDDAVQLLESVVDRATGAAAGFKAAALNKLGTVYSLGFERHEAALDLQEQAIALQRESGENRGLVVSLVHAAQTCVALDRLDRAKRHADELAELGQKFPPADIEWLSYVPALVDAHRNRWDRAKPRFRATIAELERKRRQFDTAVLQRQWCEQKAFMYGNAIEAAIVAGECEEAITYLELARNRYLDSVARAHGVADRAHKGVARSTLDDDGFLTAQSLENVVPADTALVWCGGFPRGLGVVAAWRDGAEIALGSGFHPEITERDLSALFQGDVKNMLAAHRAGRSVEFVMGMTLSDRELNLGANPYWQGHDEDWNRSMAGVTDAVARDIWPKILAACRRPVANIVLLPSVGCSELPLCAAAPERWPDGTSIAVAVAPGIDALPSAADKSTAKNLRLAQVVNPSEDPALLSSPLEANAVRALFDDDSKALRGRRASTKRVAEALRDAGIFHFIGHAYYDWRDPLDSGLFCARRRTGAGVLTVRDLFDLVGAIETPLVVLSACQIGNVQAGDTQNDFINLPTALVTAGARAVIAPRWLVDDVAVSMLLAHMFEHWRRGGMQAGAALAAARHWLRDEVTRRDVESWLTPAGEIVNARQLTSLRKLYVETYASDQRPFRDVAHWGAFELTGDPTITGANHA